MSGRQLFWPRSPFYSRRSVLASLFWSKNCGKNLPSTASSGAKTWKRILLEAVTLWSRLSFNQKSASVTSSATNREWSWQSLASPAVQDWWWQALERFLKCCDCETIWAHYGLSSRRDLKWCEGKTVAAETVLTDDPLVTHSMLVYNETIEIRPANQGKQSLTLMVPADQEAFTDYVHLKNNGRSEAAINRRRRTDYEIRRIVWSAGWGYIDLLY